MARRVFLDHDGGVDDFLALLLLCSYGDVELIGVSVTPADTIIEAVRSGVLSAIDRAEESGALPSIAATPLREIVKRAPVSELIGAGETIAGLVG